MNTLVIHPRDPSTEFLRETYAHRDQTTVVRGGVDRTDMTRLIEQHDQVLMMGHGTPHGLLGVGQFDRAFAIDGFFADVLSEKEAAYIWCYASEYVNQHRLPGFSTGMFISENAEAWMMGVRPYVGDVEESNQEFAELIASSDSPAEMFALCHMHYRTIGWENPVASYNWDRIRYYGSPSATRRNGYDETLNRRTSWPNANVRAVRKTANMDATRSPAIATDWITDESEIDYADWLGI